MIRFRRLAYLVVLSTLLFGSRVRAQDTIPLGETFTTPSGAFSVKYRTDWLAQGTEKNGVITVTLANSQAALNKKDNALSDADVLVHVGTTVTGKSTTISAAEQTFLGSLAGKIRYQC